MNVTDFFSAQSYVYIPSKKTPRAVLAIDTPVVARNSLKLYSPFSFKAIMFRHVLGFLSIHLNDLKNRVASSQLTLKADKMVYG